jgi:hypothetical protein
VREFNVWQLAAEAEKGGFSAMVLKDHFRDPGGSRGVGPRQVIDIAGKMS